MLAHCFNPELARWHVQSSDWPARLSIIKRVLNIAFIQFPTSKLVFVRLITILSFKIRSLFKFYLLGLFSQTRAIYNVICFTKINLSGY